MIVAIAGATGTGIAAGSDLSPFVDRTQGFDIEAAIGKRIDTSHFWLMDTLPSSMQVPDRAECWIYDAAAGANVVDPPWAISAYNTFKNGAGSEVTSSTPANWTPRLFAGYVATPEYTHEGPQRYIEISCQDYTTRLRTTVTNMAFAAGNSDQTIINQIFARYRPDYNTANVSLITASFPAITYPVHTLEQCLERIIKVSRGYYRADYYKQLWYGIVGQQVAPFNLSDVPIYANPVPNPQFDGGFTSWSTYAFPGATAATRTIDAATSPPVGTQAFKLVYGGSNTWEGEVVSVAVPSGTIVFSVYLKAAAGGTSVNMYCDDPLNPQATFVLTTSWQRYFFSATGLTAGTRNLYLRCGAGTFWATGVQLEPGTVPGTFNTGGTLSSFPTENLKYTPDGSGLANRVWVVGSTYLSTQQDYQIPPALVNGTTYQFPLPGNPEVTGMTISVAGADQGTIGAAPGDGDTATPSSFKYNTLISHVPATVSFKTPPGAGQAVHVIGKFRYPLVQVVTDSGLIAATNGVVFEAVVRDKRINDSALAKAVGQAFLKNQGSTLKGGSCEIRTRQFGGRLLQPGHVISIKNDVLFRNILKDASGNPTTTAVVVITQLKTDLDDDTFQPYKVTLSFADRNVSGGY